MMEIKVLGTGCCGSCAATAALIERMALAKGVAVSLTKVEDLREVMRYGIMSTPGVVIDGKVVHAGGVPGRDKIEKWLAAAAGASICCGAAPAAGASGRELETRRAGSCC